MESNMNTNTNSNTDTDTKSRLKCEFEDLKSRLVTVSESEALNLDNVLAEINRIEDTVITIENEDEVVESTSEPKPKAKSKSKSKSKSKPGTGNGKELEYDESTLNFWRGFHEELPQSGFEERPFVRDVQIICRDGSIKVHRVVLIAASDLFRDVFKETDEENPVVHLFDWSLKEIRPVVDLLYRGQVLIHSNFTASIWQLLNSLKIHSTQTNLNLSPATALDLAQVRKSPLNLSETNCVKFSAPRLLYPAKFPPAAVLNEFCPKLEFLYENRTSLDEGFVVKAFFQHTNKTYFVTDSSKKGAKNKCAAAILHDLGIQGKYQNESEEYEMELDGYDSNGMESQSENGACGSEPKAQTTTTTTVRQQPKKNKKRKKRQAESSLSSAVAMGFNNVDVDQNVVQRIINIPNLEENAWSALSNLNGSQPIQFGFPRERNPPYYSFFTCQLRFRFSWFFGTGVTQKEARTRASFQALLAILGPEKLRVLCHRSNTLKLPLRNPSTSKSSSVKSPEPNESQNEAPAAPPAYFDVKLKELGLDQKMFDKIKGISHLDKNPYIALNCLNTGPIPPQYDYQAQENPHSRGGFIFVCRLKFEEQEFIAQGDSKRRAKEHVGRKALISIFGAKIYKILLDRSKTLKKSEKPLRGQTEAEYEPEPNPEEEQESEPEVKQEPAAETPKTCEFLDSASNTNSTVHTETTTEIETETENFLNDMLENYG